MNQKHKNIDEDTECGFVPMNLVPVRYLGKLEHEPKLWGACKKGYTHFRNDDVLLAKITPCFENGKSALVSDLPNGIGAGSTEYFVMTCKQEILYPKYLYAFMKTRSFMDNCRVMMSGSVGHKRVPKDYLLDYVIPLSPLPEQIRIANKLDSLLAKVETAQTRLEKIPALLKRFRQAVLAAATSGELTREWREGNSLIWNIDQVTINSIAKDEKYSLGIGPFGSNLKVVDYRDEGHPLVFVREIRANNFGGESTKFVDDDKFAELVAHRVKPGSLLITKMGDPPGDVAIYPENRPEGIITSDCIKLDVDPEKANRDFVYLYLQSKPFQTQIQNITAGVAQQKVNLKKFRELLINLPEMDEQAEIVRRVESLFAMADTVEKQYQAAKARLDKLTQAILAKAFRGELVPQDPNDEPAAELLKRIQAERTSPKPGSKTHATN